MTEEPDSTSCRPCSLCSEQVAGVPSHSLGTDGETLIKDKEQTELKEQTERKELQEQAHRDRGSSIILMSTYHHRTAPRLRAKNSDSGLTPGSESTSFGYLPSLLPESVAKATYSTFCPKTPVPALHLPEQVEVSWSRNDSNAQTDRAWPTDHRTWAAERHPTSTAAQSYHHRRRHCAPQCTYHPAAGS